MPGFARGQVWHVGPGTEPNPRAALSSADMQTRPLGDRRGVGVHATRLRRRPRRVPRVVQGRRACRGDRAPADDRSGQPIGVGQGVVRGLHFAAVPPSQAKYVYCPQGAVLDVVVDIRVGSPTFGEWDAVRLDDVDRRAVYVSEGLGHAFMALQDGSAVDLPVLDVLRAGPRVRHEPARRGAGPAVAGRHHADPVGEGRHGSLAARGGIAGTVADVHGLPGVLRGAGRAARADLTAPARHWTNRH